MRTLRKIIRKKRNKLKCKRKTQKIRKNKVNKGGKINHSAPLVRLPSINIQIPNNEIELAKSKLSENVEYCGKYVTDNFSGATCILRQHETNKGNEIDGRPCCDISQKDLYGIVWHTHPNTSKFYPSVEDIIMVKKNRNGEKIKLSVIYTSIGVWLLEGLGDDLDKSKIERINTNFYHNCFKGRPNSPGFNLQHVLNYINSTYADEMFIDCEMNISFEPYTPGQIIYTNLTNVRQDALTP